MRVLLLVLGACVTTAPAPPSTAYWAAQQQPRADPTLSYATKRYPDDVVDRCARLLASASQCGYGYDVEVGWLKNVTTPDTVAQARTRCDVEAPAPGQPATLPAPTYHEGTVAAVETAGAQSCQALRAELREHGPVLDRPHP